LSVKIKDELKVSLGGNISSHQANQLFMGLDFHSLGVTQVDYNANFQMGNSFSGVSLDGRLFLSARIPGYVGLKLAYSNKNYSQSQSLFYEDLVPAFIKKRERFVRIRYGFPFLEHSKAEVFAGIGTLTDMYYQTSVLKDQAFDVSRYNLFNAGFRFERKSLNYRQYPTQGRHQYIVAQYIMGDEDFRVGGNWRFEDVRRHNWFYVKGSWVNYPVFRGKFNLGLMGEAVFSNKKLSSNYTASILRASAFTPTPHSKIAFNEAFHADSYLAAGVMPLVKVNDRLHFRFEGYGFLPVRVIKRDLTEDTPTVRYGKYFNNFHVLGEAAVSYQLPFVSVGLFVNGYSYPKKNFNVGLNIGYLLFDSGFFD
jgi:NTE family protein